jgi:hypothetical protein
MKRFLLSAAAALAVGASGCSLCGKQCELPARGKQAPAPGQPAAGLAASPDTVIQTQYVAPAAPPPAGPTSFAPKLSVFDTGRDCKL